MLGNLISASNKEEARKRGPLLLCRVGGKVSNEAWPLPQIAASRFYWERPKLPSVQTGCSNGRCRSLEDGEERIDVDVGPFLVMGQVSLDDHTHDVLTVAINRDGRRSFSNEIIFSSDSEGVIRIWKLEYGQELHQLTKSSETYSLAIDSEGRFLVSGANGPIYLWDSR
jgi:WD40 repeat protein